MSDRISFRNGLLKIKVFIDDKMRELPIRMRKMQEQKENMADSHFLLTSVNSRIEEEKESRLSSKLNGREEYSGARLKLMMLRENNKIKKAITKVPEFSSSTPANSQEYPYTKPQTVHRYKKYKAGTTSTKLRRPVTAARATRKAERFITTMGEVSPSRKIPSRASKKVTWI